MLGRSIWKRAITLHRADLHPVFQVKTRTPLFLCLHVFAVHALDVESLDVNDEISPAVAGFNLRFHTIARAVMIPVFGH